MIWIAKRVSYLSVTIILCLIFSSFNNSSESNITEVDEEIPVLLTPLKSVQSYLDLLLINDPKIESIDFAEKADKPYLLIKCSDSYVYI